MKKKYKLKKWVKIVLLVFITISIMILIIPHKSSKKNEVQKKETKQVNKKIIEGELKEEIILEATITEPEKQEITEETTQEEAVEDEKTYETRMTSYYASDELDTGNCTGSGLCDTNFQVNENGWYTYHGKLVVAAATEYLLKYGFQLADGVKTYKYYDEITLNIDGIDYEAIILDSCGSSMKTGRIDLFVIDKEHIKDTQIVVKE